MSSPSSRLAPAVLRLALAWVLGGSVTLALADEPAPLVRHGAESTVLPVLNAQSGRVEALLLLDQGNNVPTPLDRLFPRPAPAAGLGFEGSLGELQHVRASLQVDSNVGLALLCNQGVNIATTLGPLRQQCLLAQIGGQDELMLPSAARPGVAMEAGWRSPQGGFDMSFGLSWLDSPLQVAAGDALPRPGEKGTFSPVTPLLAPQPLGELSLRQAYWSGSLDLGNQSWLSAGASIGSQELDLLLGGPQRWDSTTVTFGVGYRGLSGNLTGRLIELPQGQGSFSGIDLGFSWRTPWQGELSFGAQNLLNQKPDTSKWPLNELPALDMPGGGRTPYVRYKQDL